MTGQELLDRLAESLDGVVVLVVPAGPNRSLADVYARAVVEAQRLRPSVRFDLYFDPAGPSDEGRHQAEHEVFVVTDLRDPRFTGGTR